MTQNQYEGRVENVGDKHFLNTLLNGAVGIGANVLAWLSLSKLNMMLQTASLAVGVIIGLITLRNLLRLPPPKEAEEKEAD